MFRLQGILLDFEADNRIRRAIGGSISDNQEFTRKLIENPGLRGLVARDLITEWIKIWANFVIELTESFLEDALSEVEEAQREYLEQEVFGLFFDGTGRDDIRNFMIPLIVGNLKKPLGFETSPLPQDFLKYSYEVFA